MSKKKPNMKDVAQLANVSIGTVSKYINGNSSITAANQKRIQEAIDKLDYTPNVSAQKLASGQANSILMYIVHEDPVSTASWLYDLPIIQGISSVFSETKYSLQLAMDPETSIEAISSTIITKFQQKSIDGVIIISPWSLELDILIRLIDLGIPYVLVGAENKLFHNYEVLMDNYSAISSLIDHLAQRGHKRVAMINGLSEQYDMLQRLRGFKDSVLHNQLVTSDTWNSFGLQTMEDGNRRMREILKNTPLAELPTGIVCGNDHIAAGVMQAIHEAGLRIPEDIAVTGYDDITLTSVLEPSLTTVSLPTFRMGVCGAEMMVRRLDNTSLEHESVTLPCSIILRQSTDHRL